MYHRSFIPTYLALILIIIGGGPFHTISNAAIPHKTPEWVKTANAYEVNLRHFTKEGTVAAFVPHLERLKEMGVDLLVFLPVYDIGKMQRKGSLGDPYSIRDFTGFNREFGQIEDFKNMVDEAHRLGMHVVLDWESAHTAVDHVWTKKHPDWFVSQSDSGAVLDYDNEDMCSGMIDAMHYWVDEIGVDGYRCYHAGEVPGWFWEDIWPELEVKRPLLGIATEEDKRYFDEGFDMLMANYLYKILETMAKKGDGGRELKAYMQWRKDSCRREDLFMNYLTSYALNSHKGPLRERIGNRTKMLSILTVLLDGTPIIMGGQEAALSNSLPCCDKGLIPWYSYIRAPLFKKLFDLRHQHIAMAAGLAGGPFKAYRTNSGGTVVAFSREKDNDKVFYEMNLEDRHYIFQFIDKVPEEPPMIDYFTGKEANVADLNKQYTTAGRMEFRLWIVKNDK